MDSKQKRRLRDNVILEGDWAKDLGSGEYYYICGVSSERGEACVTGVPLVIPLDRLLLGSPGRGYIPEIEREWRDKTYPGLTWDGEPVERH